jgi:predicted permease
MRVVARLRSFLQSVIRRTSMERQMADEMAFHLAARADDLMRQRGLPLEEARRVARLEFGSTERYREESRQSLGLKLVDGVRSDLRYAVRTLTKSWAFTAAAVATLALGIGATTAIFSLMHAIAVRDLPVDRPEALVVLRATATNAIWEAVRDQQDVFESAFATSNPQQFDFADGAALRDIDGVMVSGAYFTTLGIAPAAGRLFTAADDARGCPQVAVLSHQFWRTQFDAAPSALGSTVMLNREAFQVIGVSAAGFSGVEVGRKFDVAVPLCATARFDKRNLDSRTRWWLTIMGRVKPGLTLADVQARLDVLSPSVLRAALPDGTPARQEQFLKRRLEAVPAAAGVSSLRRTFETPLRILMAGVAIVLLITCANIAGLTLARATTRAREMAVRAALGASRRRLIRQLLTESVLLAGLGAIAGVLVAKWGAELLVRNLSTGQTPLFVDVPLDARLLGFAASMALVTGVVIGLVPAFRATRDAATGTLKTRGPSGPQGRSRFFAGRSIVALQVALSLVLLVSGGLLLRSFTNLLTLDAGFDRGNVLVVTLKPGWFAVDSVRIPRDQRAVAFDDAARRLQAIPGVVSVARAFVTPIADDNWVTPITTDVPGGPKPHVSAWFNFVTPGYFDTLRTPILSGRDFTPQDTRTAARVAIVNESLARTYFPGLDPIGRRFRGGAEIDVVPDVDTVEIVGIVKDAKYMTLRETTPPTAYLPVTQSPTGPGADAEVFLIRTATAPAAVVPAVQQALASLARDMPLRMQTLADQVSDNIAGDRVLATLAGFFGGLALVLAMIGLYGLLSYFVAQQQAEFGIRMALGAEPGAILRLVLGGVLAVIGAGMAIGMVVALASVTALQALLFNLAPRDTTTMVGAAAVLALLALVAGYVPARRATRVDPVIALRSE